MQKRIFRETDGVRGVVGEEPLTEKTMRKLGWAIGQYFGGGRMLVGRDTRESGEWIGREISLGMSEAGCEVWDIGVVTTPCLGVLTETEDVAGGVMVTASHNTASQNGVKVFDRRGGKLTDDEELDVEKWFFGENEGEEREVGEAKDRPDLVDRYIDKVIGGTSLAGWKICVDSAGGGAWGIAAKLFERAGAEMLEVGPQPDGKNINVDCGVLFPEKLSDAVMREGADMGVALDGDGDRLALVDDKGRIWNGDRITAMLALWMKEEGRLANDAVVMTEYTNLSAELFLRQRGVRVEKVINGDRAVAWKCEELGAVLGGEMTGHVIDMEWLSASDDLFVAMRVAKIARERGVKLSDLWPDYEVFPSRVWNIEIRERVPLEEMKGWSEEFAKWQGRLGTSGRTFARYAGTEDILRILVEARDAGVMEEAGEALSAVIKREIGK